MQMTECIGIIDVNVRTFGEPRGDLGATMG